MVHFNFRGFDSSVCIFLNWGFVWVSGLLNQFAAHRCWFAWSFKADYGWFDALQMSRCRSGVCFCWGWTKLWSPQVLTWGHFKGWFHVSRANRRRSVQLSSLVAADWNWLLQRGLMPCRIVKFWNGLVLVLMAVSERAAGFYCGLASLTDCQDRSGPHLAWP